MSASSNASSKLLRILVLHGFRDNAMRRLKQIEPLTRKLRGVSFHAMDAPFRVSPEEAGSETVEVDDFRKWWSLSKTSIFTNAQCDTIQESLAAVREHLRTSDAGPFDGILGFSQGAVLVAALLLTEQAQSQLCASVAPRFAILVGGFPVSDREVLHQVRGGVSVPMLHISGDKDTLVPPEMSRLLQEQLLQGQPVEMSRSQWLSHPGGHYVPSSSAARQTIQAWLNERSPRMPEVSILDVMGGER